jgi:hypothetical protein
VDVPRVYTMITDQTGSGRVAVLARKAHGQPWRQVDSCQAVNGAEIYAAQLEADASLRADVIDEWRDEVWGKDAPITAPN